LIDPNKKGPFGPLIVRALTRSPHFLQELLILRFGLRGVQLAGLDQYAEAEGLGLAGLDAEF